MMDDSHSSKKGPTTFVHGPEMEGSFGAGENASAGAGQVLQAEEIKRDLHSRHINMIAIAGMIVRATLFCRRMLSSYDPPPNRDRKATLTVIEQLTNLTSHREPDSSSDPAKSSRSQVRQVLCWHTLSWV
jgi:hypothetical protein